MQRIVVIPAHSASKRLPGKVLQDVGGVSLLERTYRQAELTDAPVYVAAGDGLVEALCKDRGLKYIPVPEACNCGTVRVDKAIAKLGLPIKPSTAIINWQADWPGISPNTVKIMMDVLEADDVWGLVTAVSDLSEADRPNRNVVKASVHRNMVYRFTRKALTSERQYHHQGVYGFSPHKLHDCAQLNSWFGCIPEDLEQPLWLKHGNGIQCVFGLPSFGVDGPADLERISSLQSDAVAPGQPAHPASASDRPLEMQTDSSRVPAA